jgi:hypothetical protein
VPGDLQHLAGSCPFHVPAEALAELVGAYDRRYRGSGAEGTRTPGLRAASATLFQLSYSPSEFEFGCKINARPLPIPSGRKT